MESEDEEKKSNVVEKYVDLELKLASCLQHHRLASFKPRILALALISLELEKQQVQEPEMNIDWLASISYLQRLAQVSERRRRSQFLICLFLLSNAGGKWCISLLSRFDRSSLSLVQGRSIGIGWFGFYFSCFEFVQHFETIA